MLAASTWEDGVAVADWARPSEIPDQPDDEADFNAFVLFRGVGLVQRGARCGQRSSKVTPDHCTMSRALWGQEWQSPCHSSDSEVFC